jgi:hypothetical protein
VISGFLLAAWHELDSRSCSREPVLKDERMTVQIDNETWVIEAGDAVIQKKARSGMGSLAPWERLVYCLWVADYGMRNAGATSLR